MEKNRKFKSFENIYRESQNRPTKRDQIELLTDYINKLKQIIHISQFVIETLSKENEKIDSNF